MKMMHKFFVLSLLCCVFVTLHAAEPMVKVVVTANHADWVYQLNEQVTFKISVLQNGLPMKDVKVEYEIGPEKMAPTIKNEVVLKAELEIDGGTLHTGGFLRCIATVEYEGTKYRGLATAAFSPETIKPTATMPDDFRAFWTKAIADNAQIPMDARIEPLPNRSNDKVNVFQVSLQNHNIGKRVYGILCMPKAPGKYPAVVKVPGAGVRPYNGDVRLAEEGIITFEIGIHGIPVTLDSMVYDNLRFGALNRYNSYNMDNRDHYYYKHVYLGCLRANDFIFSLPEFDGVNLMVTGGSQGGALAIVTAALDKRVKALTSFYPALSDLTGYLNGRAGGWPHLFSRNENISEEKIETSRYFDVVNFARLITVPGFYSFGYNDETCPPTSMYSAFNSISAPKTFFIAKETGHFTTPEQRSKQTEFVLKYLNVYDLVRYSDFGASDFTIIKERVVDELMKPGTNDERVKEIIGRMNEDGSFKGINYADLTRVAGFPHGSHTEYLVYLARAYKNSSSLFYNDKNLKNSITRCLKFWVDNDFVGDNWHDNQITTPTNLVNLMLLMGDELPAGLVEQAQPMIRRATMEEVPGVFYGARPGGDRIAIAAIVAKNFLFLNDKEAFDDVIQIIAGEIKFTTGERGMQHDYSFHHRHDRVDNTTSYGYGKYANTFGEWSSYVANTDYQFPTDRINHLVDYYLDGIYKHMVYGVFIDIAAYDRGITHQRSSTPRGTLEIERLLQSTDYRSDELKEILKLRRGEEARIRSFAKFFWQTEYFAFQRPNFFTSVRMHSTRNRNNEEPYNGPGIVIHHRSDGANYLSLDGHEYDGIWPVYNWQKISGATILQKPKNHTARMFGGNMPVQMEGLTDFVGGVDDGLYGAVGYDFKSTHDLLEAKKSWFFFDNEYVCLGSGIKSNPDLPAYTTINQTHLRGNVMVSQGGQAKVISRGKNDLEKVKWVHHNRVGYIFPEPATINLSNRAEKGRWSDITAVLSASDELVTQDVFLLGIDHGNRPMNASYQYIVVPDVTPEEMASTSANNRSIRILSNTPDLQGVIHNELGICQLAFYKAGEVEISDGYTVKMDSEGMAMLKMNGNRIGELSVADPSRKLIRITLAVPGIYNMQGENFRTLADINKNSTLIIVDLPTDVYAGSSVTIKL